jgi:hypothetical protein
VVPKLLLDEKFEKVISDDQIFASVEFTAALRFHNRVQAE